MYASLHHLDVMPEGVRLNINLVLFSRVYLAGEETDNVENFEVMTRIAFKLEAFEMRHTLRTGRKHHFCSSRLHLVEAL
jgi:hypothetical protein